MKKIWIATAIVLVGALSAFGTIAFASGDDDDEFRASLNGYNEVNSKSTVARGSFRAELNDGVIEYKLSYANMETAAFASHIHFAQEHVNGDVIAFLCGGGDKPPCPPTTGTVEGEIDPSDIVGSTAQGIEPGSFAELVRAMRRGATYVNVHSQRWPGGEIRGQIRSDD
jgi:CHRD domain-containing protein